MSVVEQKADTPSEFNERRVWAYSVEKLDQMIVCSFLPLPFDLFGLCGELCRRRVRDKFCELSEVLCGCCEVEFIPRTTGASQSKPVEFQDALEMGKQHLHLFAQFAGDRIVSGPGNLACDITRRFMD